MSDKLRILITGGSGFVGTNLANKFTEQGFSVKVVDINGRNQHLDALVRFQYGDIRDAQLMKRLLVGVDCVIHAAAMSGVRDSLKESAAYINNNIVGTNRVLEAIACMPNCKDIRFIFLSTAGALFDTYTKDICHDTAPSPMSVYGATKVAGEALCSAYAASVGVRAMVVRLTNVFGLLCSEKDTVIANWAKAITNESEPSIYGDGRHSRDFVHIDDVYNAIRMAMMRSVVPGSIYIVGSGKQRTIREMADLFLQAAKASGYYDVPMRHIESKGVEAESCNASISRARMEIGYSPEVVSDEAVVCKITEIIEWFSTRSHNDNSQ